MENNKSSLSANKISRALIILLILLLGLFSAVALVRRIQEIRERGAVPGGPASLSLSPAQSTNQVGDTLTETVSFNTGNVAVSAIAVRVKYPYSGSTPEVTASNISISQNLLSSGTWSCPVQQVSTVSGMVNVDIACVNTSTTGYISPGTVQLATFNLTVNSVPATNPLVLTFDPVESIITSKSDGSDVLGTPTSNSTITVQQAQPTATPTIIPTATTVPTQPPQPSPTTAPVSSLIDDFEGYTGNSHLQNTYKKDFSGNNVAVFLDTNNKAAGVYGMKFAYTVGSPQFAGVKRQMNGANWSGTSGISLWLKPDNSGRTLAVRFKESSGEYWEGYQTLNGTSPTVVQIPFSSFVHPTGLSNGNNVKDLGSISEFSIYVLQGDGSLGSSVVYMDNISLIGGTILPTPTGSGSSPSPTSSVPSPTGQLAPADTTITLVPSSTTVSVGQTFTVNANINTGVNDVIGVELHISFDSTKLQAQDIVAGSFFTNPDTTNKFINNNNGTLEYTLVLPPQSAPRTGTGTLATMTFTATNTGNAAINVGSGTIVAAVNRGNQNALKSTQGTNIDIVAQRIPGDINFINNQCGDGVVDIVDYAILFSHFGEEPPQHQCADIDGNGRVDILDYVILFINFGRTS